MRVCRHLLWTVVVTALVATSVHADLRSDLLVSPSWLAAHLHDAGVVVLFTGDRAQFDAGHIPGSRQVALSDLSTKVDDLDLQMLPMAELDRRLSALGISNASHVIVVYGSLTSATRVALTLDYAGVSRVSILDGGIDAWTRDKHALTTEATPAGHGVVTPAGHHDSIVDAAFVRAHLKQPQFTVVDARAASFYDGVQRGGGGTQRAGHIAGAVNIPYTSVTNETGAFRPAPELAAIFDKAGVKKGDTIIAYCHIGQQATAVIFAARTLGYTTLLYDGSFEDWSRHADYPVDGPGRSGGRR